MTSLTARLAESARAFGRSFGNPGLRRLQLAFVGSEIGGWGYSIALWVLAFEAGGAAALGVLALVTMLVPGIAAPFTSILGDRFDRVKVMVGADLVRVALMAAAAAVAFAEAPTGILYALAALASAAGTAFRPAQAALLPSLARTPDELTAANVASSTIESVGAFAGPALGGVVIAASGPGVSFAIAAGTFLWSALLLAGIRTRDAGRGGGRLAGRAGAGAARGQRRRACGRLRPAGAADRLARLAPRRSWRGRCSCSSRCSRSTCSTGARRASAPSTPRAASAA